ncbi:MAG: CotH kinase family protein [Pseudomonadota bacterium]|nr:CotH kinase family protein [Pseudomonadota bacterium]
MLLLLACTATSVSPGRPHDPSTDPSADREDQLPEVLPGQDTAGAVDPTDAVFDPTRIATVALEMSEADWAEIRDNPWAEAWHPATFRWGAEADPEQVVIGDIAVRAFGQGSEIAGKPSLKLSFDRLVPGQEFAGLDELKLDNSSQDVGYLNEYLATGIMRRFGVPAARTGWARVTVNGAAAGFFVVLESIDDRFVERWFGNDDGVLYGMNSGYYAQGLNPMTDGLFWFEPQTSVDSDGTDLVALSEIVAAGTDDQFAAALDLVNFGRESVARSAMGSMDAFSADGNNYYLYDDGGVWHILPWDFDVDLGGYYFSAALTVDPRAPWATSPWAINPITGAAYTDPVLTRSLALGLDPDALVDELLGAAMAWEVVDSEASAAAALIRDDVYADVLGYGPSFDQRRHDVRLFLHTRLSGLAGGEVAPCVAPPDAVPLAAMGPAGTVGWGELLVDRTYWAPGFNVAGEHSCTGAFAHAPSTVTLTIPDGVTRLVGKAGLQDWAQRCGDGATFAISQGETLWQSGTITNYQLAEAFDVAVSPGPLTLVTAPNADYACDTAAWADVWGMR